MTAIGESAEQPQDDYIVEIGPGHIPGASAYDLSDDVAKRVQGGATYKLIDVHAKNSEALSERIGRVSPGAHIEIQELDLRSYALNRVDRGRVSHLHVHNVFGEMQTAHTEQDTFNNPARLAEIMRGLVDKLRPGGQLIIAETRTPNEYVRSLMGPTFARDLGCDMEMGTKGADTSFGTVLGKAGMKDPGSNFFLESAYGPGYVVVLTKKQ